jgi:threonine synthase
MSGETIVCIITGHGLKTPTPLTIKAETTEVT